MIFILSILILLILYSYILYPLILKIFSYFFNNPIEKSSSFEPEITIIIAAYNEEVYITQAIESVYNSNYPSEKINVLVGNDGSVDRTAQIVKELQSKYFNLKLHEYQRSGKNTILNNLYKYVQTELVFFLDADCRLQKDTLKISVSKLADKKIGGVLSSLKIIPINSKDNTGVYSESFYQKYEEILRIYESKISSSINSLGSLYGVKKNYLSLLPSDSVCDDFYNILTVVKNKKRFIFDSESFVIEVREKSVQDEVKRRVRLASGGLATALSLKGLLFPFCGWATFFLWSHKIMRWLTPIWMILLIICTFLLEANSFLFIPLILAQGLFYLCAFCGWLLDIFNIKFAFFRYFYIFFIMNYSALLGIIKFLSRTQNARWERIDTKG